MQHEEKQRCADCGKLADTTILAPYRICTDCYNVQMNYVKQFRANRTNRYPEIDQILPNLFLGNEDAATDEKMLEVYDIRAVLVCGSHLQSPFEHKVMYKKFPIADDPDQKILHLFPQAYEWMQQHFDKGKNILVHCAAGVSRSASFVIAYLMKKKKLKMREAYDFVKQKRPIIYPNSGFVSTLELYQQQLAGTN